jgi:hypothetical protein
MEEARRSGLRGRARAHSHFACDGNGIVETFRVIASLIDAEGNSISDWEAVLGGTYSTGVAIRWRTIRTWRNGMVIAERIGELPPEGAMGESNRLIQMEGR